MNAFKILSVFNVLVNDKHVVIEERRKKILVMTPPLFYKKDSLHSQVPGVTHPPHPSAVSLPSQMNGTTYNTRLIQLPYYVHYLRPPPPLRPPCPTPLARPPCGSGPASLESLFHHSREKEGALPSSYNPRSLSLSLARKIIKKKPLKKATKKYNKIRKCTSYFIM
jgi:hypothetical protein